MIEADRIRFWINIIVILLLLVAIFFFYTEIHYARKHGGHCLNNPMAWAEKYMREEKGIIADCSCRYIIDIRELNLTGGKQTWEVNVSINGK